MIFLISKCQIKTQEAYSLSCNLKFQTSKCSSVRLSLLLVQVVQWDLFLPLSSPVSILLTLEQSIAHYNFSFVVWWTILGKKLVYSLK